MDFQYMSDLHTEVSGSARVQFAPAAPLLLLAGDIGQPGHPAYAELLDSASRAYTHVFLIAGNHEFYHESIESGEARLVAASRGRHNVSYLQNQAIHLPNSDVSIFGGTFWTTIPQDEHLVCTRCIADYKLIKGFTPAHSTRLHTEAVSALEAALEESPGRRWVVLSHHMPKKALIAPRWANYPAGAAFASDIPVADDPRIVAWVYGHTHTGGVQGKFCCNPRGYPGENPPMTDRVLRIDSYTTEPKTTGAVKEEPIVASIYI